MSDPRGQNQTNGMETGDSSPNPAEIRQHGDEDPFPMGGIMIPPGLLGYQSRSPLFRTLSTASSGYFSFEYDSQPNSPLMTHHKSTQTRSPSCQAIVHAQQRLAQVQENYEIHLDPRCAFSQQFLSLSADMPSEQWVGRELQRIGDEFNHYYTHRAGVRNRNDWAAPRHPQRDWRERTLWLWVAFLVGRLLQIILRRR
ncbi:hypothetical protein AGOR_G00100350 [Albula goreensis]|uniref:Bcl-x interacting BH3 domain-containing protein n=1 Tax=Albula goreensis TaxID=1534307 RepID=A0A8T3DLQ1_9TELE|nr:hypothetical protein AGOR_G00100350 [Albula goreensis]